MDMELSLKILRVFRCSEKISEGDDGVYGDDDCNNMKVNMYLCPPLKNMGNRWHGSTHS